MGVGAGAIRAGQAFVEILTDTSKMESGLTQARTNLKTFASFVESAGKKLFFGGTVALAGIGQTVAAYARFEDQIRAVQAVTEGSADAFARLYEQARRAGPAAGFRPREAANAMLELGKAGLSASELENATPHVLNLARATGEDLTNAATTAAETMRVFGMDASQMEEVVDLLVVGANKSTATIEDLGESLKYAAPMAVEFGMDLKETVKIIAALANMGIKGSVSGTGFRQIILQLSDPRKQAVLRDMGIALQTATGQGRNFSDIMTDIGKAISKMQPMQRITFMKEMFDQRAAGSGLKLVKGAFDGLTEAFDNATHAGKRQADLMNDTVLGAYRKLVAQLENVQITITEGLVGQLYAFGTAIKNTLQWLNDFVIAHRSLTATIVELLAVMPVLGAAMLGFAMVVKLVSGTILAWMKTTLALKIVLSSLPADLARTHTWMEILTVATLRVTKSIEALWVVIAANPVTAGLTILAANIALLGYLAANATAKMKELQFTAQKANEEWARKNKEDIGRGDNLQKLSQKGGPLTGKELKQAREDIHLLKNRYGEFGVTIDAVADKVVAAAGAFDTLAEAIKRSRVAKLNADIAEGMANLGKLDDNMKALSKGYYVTGDEGRLGFIQDYYDEVTHKPYDNPELKQKLEEINKEREKVRAALEASIREKNALMGKSSVGGQSAATTAAVQAAANAPRTLTKEELDWQEKLATAKAESIEDEYERSVDRINAKYDLERDKIKENTDISLTEQAKLNLIGQGGNGGMVEATRQEELARVALEVATKRNKEEIDLQADLMATRASQIYDEHERAMKLIDIEYKKELQSARNLGQTQEAIDKEVAANKTREEKIAAEAARVANALMERHAESAWTMEEERARLKFKDKQLEEHLLEIERRKRTANATRNNENINDINEEINIRKQMLNVEDADWKRSRDIEELKLRTQYRGKTLALQMNELERKRALENAKKTGENIKLVHEEFDLKKQLIEKDMGGPATIGLFNPMAAGQALGYQSMQTWREIAVNTKKTAIHVERMANKAPQGGAQKVQ